MAARNEHEPAPVLHAPSPGLVSTASTVLLTVNVVAANAVSIGVYVITTDDTSANPTMVRAARRRRRSIVRETVASGFTCPFAPTTSPFISTLPTGTVSRT